MARSVFIAIPAYTGMVHFRTMQSLMADIGTLTRRGDEVIVQGETSNPIISTARAALVSKFIASNAADMIFVDYDMEWDMGSLAKLLDAPGDFVAAAYPRRQQPISYTVRPLDGAVPDGELLEVEATGVAFARLSRTMLETMIARYEDTEFECGHAPNKTAWALFDPYRVGRLRYPEDFAFCHRWRDLGGRIFVIPEIRMGHIGVAVFTGTYGEWLRKTT